MKESTLKKYRYVKRLISLNRMIEGELSYQHNNPLYKELARLEKRFPGIALI